MSMDPWEAEQEAAHDRFVDSLAKELYQEHKEQAIQEFVAERMKSYYGHHPEVAVGALKFLRKAKEFIDLEPTSSLLLSSTSCEVILKSVLLKPVVFGLVHTESLADLVADILVKQTGVDRFKELVFKILDHHIDFENGIAHYRRKNSAEALWVERTRIQEVRNRIIHRAEFCSSENARLSFEVAATFFGLTKMLVENIGYEVDKEGAIAIQ